MRNMTRRTFLLLPPLLLLACGNAPATPFAPPTDRPTFIYFYTPN